MNEYDSGRIADVLREYCGMSLVSSPEDADLLLINTCSIRAKAENKVYSELGRWRHLKQKRPGLCIAVAGCVASQMAEKIIRHMPVVDLVFGPQTLHRLPDMLTAFARTGEKQVDVSFPKHEKFADLPPPSVEGPSAYVSIMEGCNKFCTYCIVPFTRGREWSRPVAEILREVSSLAERGVREVNLLGQNVNAYRGARTVDAADAGGATNMADETVAVDVADVAVADLVDLIEQISRLDAIERIRFTTSHPADVSARLIDAYRHFPKLVSHLHLPVQSGSDAVLKRMHRGYTSADYIAIIDQLRQIRPEIAISSDFIVGFPNETDDDFEQTLALIRQVRFDLSFSFIYSPREGTRAAGFADAVPLATKKARLAQLQSLLQEYANAYSQQMIGRTEPVLVTRLSRKNSRQLAGRTVNNRVVNFSGQTDWIGRIIPVKITEALPNSLRGISVE